MIILGLGSNVGNRLQHMEDALYYLNEEIMHIAAISPIYKSPALLKPDAPKDWNMPFLNMAISGETHLDAQSLLTQIKCIEKKIGRVERGTWGPREIDIDILAYDNLHIDASNLKVPHTALCKRAFALLPIVDVAPNWRYPVKGEYFGKTAYEIAQMTSCINQPLFKTSYMVSLQKNRMVA